MDADSGFSDVARMRRLAGETDQEFWERKFAAWEQQCAADPDIIVTDRTVEVLRRQGETEAEYTARWVAAAPPLSERQKATIRIAAGEYWRARRTAERRKREEAAAPRGVPRPRTATP